MILFFNKKTREIIGFIEGRTHPPEVIEGAEISTSETPKKDIGKYVVPFKVKYKIVGKKKKPIEMVPDVPFADKILEFERNLSKIREYKVKLNKNGIMKGFEKND